jgi:hypothetical protein
MRDIGACHTPAAGRARWRCPRCGKRQFTFVGCGNRHCPACGGTPHVHFIATGGGLDPQGQWVSAHPRFLVPVPALSVLFRARFRDALREQYPRIFARIKPKVWPSAFRKIRYFGLHHSSKRPQLRALRAAMAMQAGMPVPTPDPPLQTLPPSCPDCHTPMRFEARIAPFAPLGLFIPSSPTRGPP